MLPIIHGEFGVVADPEPSFSDKGNAWLRLRVVAKDRVRDQNGTWSDGDPMFLNALVFGKQAENLTDSISKGDTIVLIGRLKPNKWTDKEGVEHNDVQIAVDEIAVSVRWGYARTQRYGEQNGVVAPNAVESSPDEMPF